MPRHHPTPERRRVPRGPDRKNRPSAEELGGTSEYQIRSATDDDAGDPMTTVIAGTEAAQQSDRERSLIEEPLSVPPDELGADYLRGAVQDGRPQEPQEPELEELETESESLQEGEERMLDGRLGSVDDESGLITSLETRSEEEGDISRLTEEVGKEIRIPDRAARIREQSRRVAELRSDRGGEYLGRRKKPRRGTGAPR